MSTAVAEKLEVCPKISATVRERMTKSRVRFLLTRPFYGTLAARLVLTEANYMPTI